MNFRATTNASHIYRERTSAEIATMNSASVSDSFAEVAKNATVVDITVVLNDCRPSGAVSPVSDGGHW